MGGAPCDSRYQVHYALDTALCAQTLCQDSHSDNAIWGKISGISLQRASAIGLSTQKRIRSVSVNAVSTACLLHGSIPGLNSLGTGLKCSGALVSGHRLPSKSCCNVWTTGKEQPEQWHRRKTWIASALCAQLCLYCSTHFHPDKVNAN